MKIVLLPNRHGNNLASQMSNDVLVREAGA